MSDENIPMLPDGVYVVELSFGPVRRAGFEVINQRCEHCASELHDWMRKQPRQLIRCAQRVADVGAEVNFPVGRPRI